MTIREDVVASAVSFLQDPNVVSSPLENKLSFLRSKNLTQEEIDIAFARAGLPTAPVPASSPTSPPPSAPVQQPQPYYGQYQTQPYGWQAPPEVPKRDWRDWFIMATVVGGVSYGLYTVSKRYLYPLVSPPTPEKLEQDKAMVDEQFEKAFSTLEQLSKDTEDLKASERERTEKLDKVLDELDTFMRDTKSASRRHEDETDRLREEMKALKSVIPKSMAANKEFTDNRLKEITTEVRSLKSLISQRMGNSSGTSSGSNIPAPPSVTTNGFLKPSAGATNAASTASGSSSPGVEGALAKDLGDTKQAVRDETSPQSSSTRQDFFSTRTSPFGSGMATPKASIPAWQLAASKSDGAAAGSSQNEAGSSS
ncbi:peroxisomal membrane anchor protein conserved region-domain-containing protein [Daldinia caldariorum]|uniref:peroxisomal membrane anchor protein conserved region-domain-containing protein n=1 Tax=Daldinia caldariorum TaxID=326644 RepID=UPI0020086BF4|nr:peroxisomal membrane anchor protein conserved region-domain-containing protein [Daldinia caldariorum]KAI1472827.1 peroxisomal membrane anchor protein conserved region-domain-containing protein [Daldinia caldariorum]